MVAEFVRMAASTKSDRVLFPKSGFRKSDAMAYYKRAAKVLLPHLKNAPLSFKRYPDTVDGEAFWEKSAPGFTPKWVKTFDVPRRAGGEDIHYIVVNDLRTLLWLVDIGTIELHTFQHRAPRIDVASAVVFDLDPGAGATFADCCRVALMLRDALLAVRLQSFAKVSGSKGLQVYVPLNTPGVTHDATETFAQIVAAELARAAPELITAKMSKEVRTNRVFIDWGQNADYKTTVCVYSLRATREEPFVSMPVTWREVERLETLAFTPSEAMKRMRRDLFLPVLTLEQRLPISVQRAARAAGPLAHARGDRRTQSSRREFEISGDELSLEMEGTWQRWIVPSLNFEERGTYELIEGSDAQGRFLLWFSGKTLNGAWTLTPTSGPTASLHMHSRRRRP